MADFTSFKQIKKKKKKNLLDWKNWVGHTRKTGFSFFMALGCTWFQAGGDVNAQFTRTPV